jgi:hypothetical protein
MGLACPNCNGMGTVDGKDCPQCVGKNPDAGTQREPVEVTPEFQPAVSSVADLPATTATPSGNTVAGLTEQPAAIIPEGVTNPASPEAVEVSDSVIAEPITEAPNDGGVVVVNEAAAEAAVKGRDKATNGAEGYEAQTVAELQDELRDRDLAVSGTKDELIARLEEDDNAPQGANA